MVTFAGKLVLAPMVRAGELPTRLLALRSGAELVWSPEIVDKKLLQCSRVWNEKLRTVDFVVCHGAEPRPPTVVFRTCPGEEQGRLIFQMGTSTPSLAVDAALKVIGDVAGIDVNAGCPKHFSIHSGMGAALLKTPDKLCSILQELVSRVGAPNGKPISVKIRILEDEESTLDLVRKLCGTGIANLTVHCRTTPMRNREAPIRGYIPSIYSICRENGVSLIINGGIRDRGHYTELQQELSLADDVGGMIAEHAERNPSVFSREPLKWYETCKKYIEIANAFDNHVGNTKYMLTRIVPGKSPFFQFFTQCKTKEDIDYVTTRLGLEGEVIESPVEYLKEKRLEEKLSKQKKNNLNSQQAQKRTKSDGVGADEAGRTKKVKHD